MTIALNTYLTFNSKRNREEFSNAIYMITPEDTPFISNIGKDGVDSTHPEWSTDTLVAPNVNNAVVQGDEFSYGAILPTTRIGNFTQISRKEYIVSRTQEKTLKAGPQSELGRQRRKKGTELRKDMEAILLSNQASLAGSAAVAPLLGGLPSWLTTNVDRSAAGVNGGFNSGTGFTVAATNGTAQRAFTLTVLRNIIVSAFTNGGKPTMLMTSPYVKTVFSSFMSDPSLAAQRMATSASKQATLVGAADTYLSDFGTVDVVPNRVLGASAALARNAFLIDTDMIALGMFDDVQEVTPAKTGDATKKVLITEYTLKIYNEAAHAVAADLFGLTAST